MWISKLIGLINAKGAEGGDQVGARSGGLSLLAIALGIFEASRGVTVAARAHAKSAHTPTAAVTLPVLTDLSKVTRE